MRGNTDINRLLRDAQINALAAALRDRLPALRVYSSAQSVLDAAVEEIDSLNALQCKLLALLVEEHVADEASGVAYTEAGQFRGGEFQRIEFNPPVIVKKGEDVRFVQDASGALVGIKVIPAPSKPESPASPTSGLADVLCARQAVAENPNTPGPPPVS